MARREKCFDQRPAPIVGWRVKALQHVARRQGAKSEAHQFRLRQAKASDLRRDSTAIAHEDSDRTDREGGGANLRLQQQAARRRLAERTPACGKFRLYGLEQTRGVHCTGHKVFGGPGTAGEARILAARRGIDRPVRWQGEAEEISTQANSPPWPKQTVAFGTDST